MKIKIDLNIYQLPENKMVAKFEVPEDWGLEKIMAFAEDQLTSLNRLCRVAGSEPNGGGDIGGHLKSFYEAAPVEKSEIKKPVTLHKKDNAPELLEALKSLQKQIHAHFKLDVKKHFSLLVADSMASKAIHIAEGGER